MPGGYSARMRVGAAPPTRLDFACEAGGRALADSRPDAERLRRLSRASGGRSVDRSGLDDLPLPAAAEITVERHSSPFLPAWLWSLAAAVSLGGHWMLRRRAGLS
jgi:hypothetical protein